MGSSGITIQNHYSYHLSFILIDTFINLYQRKRCQMHHVTINNDVAKRQREVFVNFLKIICLGKMKSFLKHKGINYQFITHIWKN